MALSLRLQTYNLLLNFTKYVFIEINMILFIIIYDIEYFINIVIITADVVFDNLYLIHSKDIGLQGNRVWQQLLIRTCL